MTRIRVAVTHVASIPKNTDRFIKSELRVQIYPWFLKDDESMQDRQNLSDPSGPSPIPI